jgi:DNA-binding transcriptional MerR regulator
VGDVDPPLVLFTIGEVARRTGLSPRTVRFYSDAGLIPARDRSSAGHRLFDADAVARLELVRTLRTLDIDLPAIARILDQHAQLAAVAALHAEAMAIQIRTLQLRRSVLLAVAKHPDPIGAITVMTRLAQMSENQRQHLIDAFWDEMCDGMDLNSEAERRMRAARPELPDNPSPEQVEAWIEFAELIEDPDFRAKVRTMTSYHSQQRREASNDMTVHTEEQGRAIAEAVQLARDAVAEGIDPESQAAAALLADIVPAFGQLPSVSHVPDDNPDSDLRARLAERLEVRTDERAERYSQLVEIISGWPRTPPTTPAIRWLVAALRAPERS